MDYKATLKAATAKLDALVTDYGSQEKRLADTAQEVAQLVEVVERLAPLAGETATIPDGVAPIVQTFKQTAALEMGITDRIRQGMQANPTYVWLPIHMRTWLENAKYDFSKHTNPMATIHSVFKRLTDQQQAIPVPQPDGKTGYRWNPAAKL